VLQGPRRRDGRTGSAAREPLGGQAQALQSTGRLPMMLAMDVNVSHESGAVFRVVVTDATGSSTHMVTVMPSDVERYAPGRTPEELLEQAFAFLLAREPKEAILPRFELPVIERYFPEFGEQMRDR
jgi:hypothetical protein